MVKESLRISALLALEFFWGLDFTSMLPCLWLMVVNELSRTLSLFGIIMYRLMITGWMGAVEALVDFLSLFLMAIVSF